jgi:hypothetical protein
MRRHRGPASEPIDVFDGLPQAFFAGVIVGILLVVGAVLSAPYHLRRVWQRYRGSLPEVVISSPTALTPLLFHSE